MLVYILFVSLSPFHSPNNLIGEKREMEVKKERQNNDEEEEGRIL
jgi:hypothetical protein